MPIPSERRVELLLEGVVVLVSILLAFLLEGWRQERELRHDLNRELASVQLALERNRELAAAEIAPLDRVSAAGDAVVAAMLSAAGESHVAVDDTLAALAIQWNISFSPALGAVDALISSGRLAQIENPELKLGLAGLREIIRDVVEDEIAATEYTRNLLSPEMARLDALPGGRAIDAFLRSAGEAGLTPQERIGGDPLPSFGSVSLPTDLAIRNYLSMRLGSLGSARSEFTLLRDHLDMLVSLVVAEQGQL